MFSVIIATRDSERPLVATLAALVPGATAGLVREVIIADGGSRDDTEEVADVAGCRFIKSGEPLGVRLKAGAAASRGDWLMFLDPGVVPDVTWIDDTAGFLAKADVEKAAVFAPLPGMTSTLRRALGVLPRPEQGLMIAKSLYTSAGGHRPNVSDPRADLLRRIGRRRLVRLRTVAVPADS